MQGFIRNLEVTAFAFLFALSLGFSATPPSEIILKAKVRDFKEVNTLDTVGMHPDFNRENGCSAQELAVNTVESDIDVTNPIDGAKFAGDERGPKLVSPLPASIAKCYTPSRFGEW